MTGGLLIGLISIWQNTGHQVPGKVFWIIAILGIFVACYRAWNEERIAKEKALSEKASAELALAKAEAIAESNRELARQQKPAAAIRFAYENNCAWIYVKNIGAIGEFFSTLRMGMSVDEIGDMHARWSHANDARTRIPSGVERKLLLAKLHYTYGAIATSQWEIFFTRDGIGIGSVRPTYSSVVGHSDAQAPDVWIEIIVASDPDMDGGIKTMRIMLHSNRAEEIGGRATSTSRVSRDFSLNVD